MTSSAPSDTALPTGTVRPGSLSAWVLAARPKTLTAALSPVLVGSALAFQQKKFNAAAGLLALVGALLLQIASNFANDVFDYEKGADAGDRLGPPRAVQSGWLTPGAMRVGLGVVVSLSLGVGAALAWQTGPVIVVLGMASILAALAYTGGPYPLGYHGLGDVFVVLFFGLVAVLGTEFVHGGSLEPISVLYALALGGLATNLLVVNNVRDRASDAEVGKRTLAVRFGRGFAELEFRVFTAFAYAVPLIAFATNQVGWPALLPLFTLPLGVRNVREVHQLEGRALNPLLGRVAALLFAYSALAALGLGLSRVAPTLGGP
jgi:1,4-dihydroxy-2-naphthoate polyprenyltransferase